MTLVRSVFAVLLALALAVAFAQQTPAGTQIQNQATAQYVDSSGETQTTNSNQVVTIVQQVYDVAITPDSTGTPGETDFVSGQSQDATPGSTVYFPYTLTNEGNGADSFDLTSDVAVDSTGAIADTTPIFYLDENNDGKVQSGEDIVTSIDNVAAGESVKFIMAYQIPTDVDTTDATADTVIASPIGTSQGDTEAPVASDSNNYHQTNVVQGAALRATKTVDQANADPGDTLTYTVTVTNTGSADATNVVISDELPGGVTYVSATATPANTVDFDAGTSTVSTTFATINSGQAVELEITATVNDDTLPGDLANTATITYDDDQGNPRTPVDTNTTTTTVLPEAGVAVGPNGDPLDGLDGDDDTAISYTTSEGYTITGADNADTQVLAEANAGTNVSFINTVQNTGTDTDTFNLSTTPTLPDGASVILTRLDGTPLTDTDNDGTVDSGPLAPGENFSFITRVVLPSNVPAEGDAAVNAAEVTVTATSSLNPDVDDDTTNVIQDIAGPGVDIGNDNGDTEVDGDDTASDIGVNQTVEPGESASFPLDIVNTGGSDDSFDLTGTVDFTDNEGNTVTVPVTYYPDTDGDGVLDPDELTAGPITNTGTIDPGEEVSVIAVVNVPADAVPTDDPSTVTLIADSPNSGAQDTFTNNTVTVAEDATFTFSPDRNGTAPSPGTVIYQHTLENTGNVNITDIEFSAVSSGNDTGFTYTYSYDGTTYYDIDALPAEVIEPGESQSFFVQVNVPAGVPQSAVNVVEVTAEATFITGTATQTVTDTTIVVGGEVRVEKEWSLDGTTFYRGDGTDADPSSVPEVAPGEDITYRLTVTNIGTADVTEIDVFDPVPTFTDFVEDSTSGGDGVECSTDGGTSYGVCPTGGNVDTDVTTLRFDINTLAPGNSVELTFEVRVQ